MTRILEAFRSTEQVMLAEAMRELLARHLPEECAAAADAEMDWVIRLISEVRSVRAEMNFNAGAKIPLVLVGAGQDARRRAATWEAEIMRLARLSSISFEDEVPKASAQIVIEESTVALPLEGVIDFGAEKVRSYPARRVSTRLPRCRSARSTRPDLVLPGRA